MISSCAGRDGVDVIALYAAMYNMWLIQNLVLIQKPSED